MPTVHLIIRGKVQGVFYRASAREAAENLGITGWIKNSNEGHVEAMVNGSQESLDQYIAWCWKGPSRARVEAVDVIHVEDRAFDGFHVIRGSSA